MMTWHVFQVALSKSPINSVISHTIYSLFSIMDSICCPMLIPGSITHTVITAVFIYFPVFILCPCSHCDSCCVPNY